MKIVRVKWQNRKRGLRGKMEGKRNGQKKERWRTEKMERCGEAC